MPSQTNILSIAGKPTAISQPGSSNPAKLRRWTGTGAGEPGGIQHQINKLFRTSPEGTRPLPHIMDEQDVTKNLGLDNSDEHKIQDLLRRTRADFGSSPYLRVQRIQHARSRLSDFMHNTKRIPADVRMEINRRAIVWWRKFGKTDYEGKPMIRHVVTKAQVESPTLLKAGIPDVKRYVAGAGGGGGGSMTAFGELPKPAPRGGHPEGGGGKSSGGGGPYIGPKGGKWANPEHTIPWKEGSGGAKGAKHEEPTGHEKAAGVEDGMDEEGTKLPEFKMRITGKDHAQMAARLKAGIEKGANLCNYSPPLCHENLGIDRNDMPQLDDDVLPAFLKSYQDKGVSVKKGTMEVGRLKATQENISAETAAGMEKSYQEGSFDPSKKPIIISKDGYVLDGHHRWAAMVVSDPASKMRVYQVDAPIKQLLSDAKNFKGVRQEAFGANVRPGQEGTAPAGGEQPPAVQKAMWMQALGAARRDSFLRR